MPPKAQKKKKPACNAFYFFMLDFRADEEIKGRLYNSLADVTTPAGQVWNKMDSDARAPYEEKAKEAKRQVKHGDIKYTTTGERIDHVVNRDMEIERAKRKMIENIHNCVYNNVVPNEFVNKVFYVAHVNYYCEVVGQDRYYPAEIAAVRFSLKHGVDSNDIFHVIFNTGEVNRGTVYEELPMGYRLTAEMVSKESHQIPLPPHNPELGSTVDIRRTFSQFIDFLRQDLDPSEPTPPVYVEDKNTVVAKNVFNWMLYEFGYDEHLIKIYNLPYLFFCLRNAAHKCAHPEASDAFVNQSIATHELDRDIYDYVRGISCKYHDLTDAFPYCSLSKVVRQVYIICDFCCPDVNIDLIPGSHVPKNADMRRIKQKTQSRATSHVEVAPPQAPSVMSEVESLHSKMANTIISDTASTSSRKPKVQSRLIDQIDDTPDLDKDFPSLPSAGRGLMGRNGPGISVNRSHMPRGRGRGRILEK